ncbi:MAG: penicillin-binding transpeptidase domain-containing protein, partial [Planctomycetota bacterium]|nr:penicillin-binding transpeptidase domain-containing protein [Planctomycetota bacterium]
MNNKRLGHVAFGFVAFLFLLLGRLAQLQIIENDEWQRQARSSRLDKDTIPFKRGRILTADQTTIAEDDSVYDLYFRYRDFRRHHLAGQLQASMSLLSPNAPTVDSCFSNAAQHALQLLELLPQHLESLALVSRRDLFYYLKLRFGIEGEGEHDKFEEWKQQAELKLSEVFPDALDYFYSRLKFFNLRVSVIESMLGPSWKGTLIAKIEQRRLELELMVLQRSLQDASARALGLSSSELRNRLREEHSRQSSAYFLHRHWQLDGSPEYLAAMLISGDDFASEQLRKQDVSQQLQLLSSLWRKISTSSPQDTAGIYRDQQYRVHRFRVISFAKGIDFKLIDLLAQQGEDFPGLYLQKNTRRVYPNDMNPQIIGMVRLPLAADLDEYRMLNDRFRQLRKMFYRNAEDEAEYRQLRHRLWSATLRPDETRGLSGIEGAFEGALRGVRGYLQVLEGGEDGKDPLELLYSPPTDGRDVVLSLDANLIAIAEKSIQRVYKETIGRMRSTFPSAELSSRFNANLPKVGFALIDLQRPYVPLLATTPDLNREQLRKNYQQLAALKDGSPLRHRALAGNYWPQETPYPGSTFKPLAAVAALLIDQSYWSKEYNCEGSFQANDRGTILRCDTRYGHQQISMRDALKKSCNIY